MNSSSSTDNANGSSGSNSSGAERCEGVLEGTIEVSNEAEAGALQDVGRIEGSLVIRGWDTASLGTSFACLREITDGSLRVSNTQNLRTLEGLEGLRSVEFAVNIGQNGALQSLKGLEYLEETELVTVSGNPNMTQLDLPRLEKLWSLELGGCAVDPKTAELGGNGILELSGFASLESLERVFITGQPQLQSIEMLLRIGEQGGAGPSLAFIQHNQQLPVNQVDELREALDVGEQFHSCNNLGESEKNVCLCLPSG